MKTSATASSGDVVEVDVKPHHKDIARVRAELASQGIAWDGWVTDEYGNRHWVDEETVRGNYPSDCPRWLRHRIGQIASELGDVDTAWKVEVAIWARGLGYEVTNAELKRKLTAPHCMVYGVPPERQRPVDKWGQPFGPVPRETMTYRMLDSWDRDELALFLKENADEETSNYVRTAFARGVPLAAVFSKAGRLYAVNGVVQAERGGVMVRPTLKTAPRVSHAAHRRVKEARERALKDFQSGQRRCAGCNLTLDLCLCPVGVEARCEELYNASSAATSRDHAWGHQHAVLITSQMEKEAAKYADNLAKWVAENNPDVASEIEEFGGEEIWQSIALYFEQTRVLPEERQETVTLAAQSIAALLRVTSYRAERLHADYVRTLYEEFDGEDASLGDPGVQEVYLGRDGVYMWYARQEMLDAYRREGDERATKHDVAFVSVSRIAQWRDRHHSLLGERSVAIDTGFAGTIPKKIAKSQGLVLQKDKGDDVLPGTLAVRLMSTNIPGFGFTWQAGHSDVYRIEHDAKNTRTAKYVDDKTPSAAVEQFVHRQIERIIRQEAREQITEILEMEKKGAVRLDDLGFISTKRKGW